MLMNNENGQTRFSLFHFSLLIFFAASFSFPVLTYAQISDTTFPTPVSSFKSPRFDLDSTAAYVIEEIFIEGNKETKSFIIQRELPFKSGDTVTEKEIDYARDRIYSTSLFTKVLIQPEVVTKNRIDILIYVEERWYIWPYPILWFRDRVINWKRLSAGCGIVDLNFRGMDERFEGMFALGYDPFGSINYTSPSMGKDRDYLLSLEANYSHGRSVGLLSTYSTGQFDDSFGDFYIALGKRLDIYSIFSIGAAYNYVARNIGDSNGVALSPNGKDIFASLHVEYDYDSRDLKDYALRGTYFDLTLEKYGLGESVVNFGRASFDMRKYLPVSNFLSVVGRFHGSFAEGPDVPRYNNVFFGYYERIRGMFNTVSEGESMLGGNAELRIPLIKQMYIEIPYIPLEQFVSNRISLYWSFFGDIGETSSKYIDLKWNRALYGYGVGLTLLLPYDITLQFDSARGSDRHLEFILDFGEAI